MNELNYRGLKHDGDDLLESDSQLRDEIINNKIIFLISHVGILAQYVCDVQVALAKGDGIRMKKAREKYNADVEEARLKATDMTQRSIDQYRERRKK